MLGLAKAIYVLEIKDHVNNSKFRRLLVKLWIRPLLYEQLDSDLKELDEKQKSILHKQSSSISIWRSHL
jgi:hypothetical protein